MRAVFVALALAGCSNGSTPACTLKGTGTATITSMDKAAWGTFKPPETTDCSSGAYLFTSLPERHADYNGSDFRLSVRVRSDTTTGTRAAGGFDLAPGTAGISAQFLNDAGIAAEYDNIADAGTITITSNGSNPGDTFAGTIDGVSLTRNACSAGSCTGAPSPVTISGTFSAKY